MELLSPVETSPVTKSAGAIRIMERLRHSKQIVFVGACTPFRALMLNARDYHDIWISSFELASLLGLKDDDSMQLGDVLFFLNRIVATVPSANLFLDCSAGWTDDIGLLGANFSELSGKIAIASFQNQYHCQKENSFRTVDASSILPPVDLAQRLQAINKSQFDGLLALRLENNVCGMSMVSIENYLKNLADLGSSFDLLIFHHKQQDVDTVLEFADKFYTIYPYSIPLVSICTSYINTPGLMQKLMQSNYRLVVVPNFGIRYEYSALGHVYDLISNGHYNMLDEGCCAMAEVANFVYDRL